MSSRGTGSDSESRPTQQPKNTEQKKLDKPIVKSESKPTQPKNTEKKLVESESKFPQQPNNTELKKQNKQLAQKKKARQRWWSTTGKKLVGACIIILVITGVVLGIVFGTDNTGAADNNNGGSTSGTAKPTLMDIGSTSCVPCQQLQPVLDELRSDYSNKVNVKFYDSWNTTAGANMANKYGVTSIPTLIFLDASGKEVARMTGYQSYDVIVAKFRSLGWI